MALHHLLLLLSLLYWWRPNLRLGSAVYGETTPRRMSRLVGRRLPLQLLTGSADCQAAQHGVHLQKQERDAVSAPLHLSHHLSATLANASPAGCAGCERCGEAIWKYWEVSVCSPSRCPMISPPSMGRRLAAELLLIGESLEGEGELSGEELSASRGESWGRLLPRLPELVLGRTSSEGSVSAASSCMLARSCTPGAARADRALCQKLVNGNVGAYSSDISGWISIEHVDGATPRKP
jgi:hypothetical protein